MPRGRRFAGRGFASLAVAATLSAAALLAVQAVLAGPPKPAQSAAPAGQSARPKAAKDPPGDGGLLEFLGGIGSEDTRWIDYLASTDPAKVAPAPKSAPGRTGQSDETSGWSQKK